MQIPISWINEIVKIDNIPLNLLVKKLTLGGFEVEEISELEINNQKQTILDISATANRSDSLSIQGISTEIAALLDKPIKAFNYSAKPDNWKDQMTKNNKLIPKDPNCSAFIALIIENFVDKTIPKWITQKLISSKIAPSNTPLDFQNYILLESGYPICIYDFEKICSKLDTSNICLSISPILNRTGFLGANKIDYELNESILGVYANEIPISIAGIIEAHDFSYSETTTTLLIEGSIFSAAKIRQQSRKIGLRTERSARYEKSLKNTYLTEALYRLISLLRINNPDLVCKIHTISTTDEEIAEPILLKYETIKEILGPTNASELSNPIYISVETITNYLTRLNFQFKFDTFNLNWSVQVPQSRTDDICREIDLVEEIGRLHGFNNFLTTLPKIKAIGSEDTNYTLRKKITNCLLNLGLNELIHYSLVKENTFIKNDIQLINPLVSDYSSLRSSLLPNLIKTVQENLKQKNLYMEGFEYGHVFFRDKLKNFSERDKVAGIFGGAKTKLSWSAAATELNWFEAKGKIEQLFAQLNIAINWKILEVDETTNFLHPYRSAELSLINDETRLGIFGQINPILSNKLNLSTEIYLFEFDLELIKNALQKNNITIYKDYPVYPKVIKDVSFIIPKEISFKTIQNILYLNGTEFLSEVNLLDEYRGQSIPEDKTSLCLQLVFQSSEKTLENKDVENIINKLQLVLINKFNANIRS
jgi:phenylalanyl-tRNA synthetase beta chain